MGNGAEKLGGAFLFVLSSSPPQRASLLWKGGAPVRKLGRRIAFWRSQNMRSKREIGDFCGAGRPRPAKSIRWMEWRAGVVAPHRWAEALFTSYVLLRKTQFSVSLRLTAPFTAQPLAALPPYGCGVPLAGKRGLWSDNGTSSAQKPSLPKGGGPPDAVRWRGDSAGNSFPSYGSSSRVEVRRRR